jgi:Skp family chaperone for outer membrane proteins
MLCPVIFSFATSVSARADDQIALRNLVAIQQAQLTEQAKKFEDLKREHQTALEVLKSDIKALSDSVQSLRERASTKTDVNASLATLKSDLSQSINDTASELRNAMSRVNEFHHHEPFRIFLHKDGNGGYMWAFEKNGSLLRWRCSDFSDFRTCVEPKEH